MRQNVTVDHIEKTITFSKAFYKKASNPKTAEYRLLRTAINENPTYKVDFKTADKKTYKGLNIAKMKAYIETQPNSEENLKSLDRVIEVAETKGSKYPLIKKWFLEKFPNYKLSEVTSEEMKKDSENETEKAQNINDNITSINEAIGA